MAAPQWKGGKCKSVQKAKAYFRHNDKDRRAEAHHANYHIDKSKTHLNFTYRGLDYKGLCKAFDDKMASVDIGRESSGQNARVVLQSVILYPPAALPREKEREWFMDAGRVMEAQFGDNLLEIQFDMDEEHEYPDKDTGEKRMSRNHGHARLFPEVNGKLNGKQFSTAAAMKRLNAALDKMSVKLYGVPMMDGTKKKGGATVESLKAASLRVEVEQLQEQADTLITDAMDKAAEITAEARRDARSAKKEADRDREEAKRERGAAWVDAQDTMDSADEYSRTVRHQADQDAQEKKAQAEREAEAMKKAAEQDAARIRQEAERDAQSVRLQVAAMRDERDEAQAERDAARRDALDYADKAQRLKKARDGLQTALQGDLRTAEAKEARQGAAALLDALGATVRPLLAQAAHDVRIPTGQVTPGTVAGSVYAELQRRIAKMDNGTRPTAVEGPSL